MSRVDSKWITGPAVVAFALLVGSCGGGDNGTPVQPPPPPPPPPAPVATVTVTPADADLLVGETAQLAAATFDAAGTALSNRAILWSTTDAQVASVVGGLVTGVGAGSATVTATSEGQSASAAVTVTTPTFEPTGDTNLSGTKTYDQVIIPEGVTVTVTDDLTMDVTGAVSIDGTLSGECVDITINGQAAVTINGSINNACTVAPSETASVTIVGNGDLELDEGTIESGGDIVIKNDPTISDADFPEEGQALSGSASARPVSGTCRISNYTFLANPTQAANGADGQHGEDGEDGRTWTLFCSGNAFLHGGVRVFGQNGGGGGRGMHESITEADASGGKGGDGGKVRLLATGSWTFTGSGNELIAGDGGIGGFSMAEGKENPDIDPAAAAISEGGPGGAAGLVEVRSLVGITPLAESGVLTIQVGDAGSGADATALGAHGMNSSQRPDKPAQAGGHAYALGGFGGTSPPLQFRATGSASTANVTITGGNGGDSNMDPGDGGDGDVDFIDGAAGGNSYKPEAPAGPAPPRMVLSGLRRAALVAAESNGGDGGKAEVTDAGGALVGNGGMGGALAVTGGHGGFGFDGCSVFPVTNGGNGGLGGTFEGNDGPGGTGKADGMPGGVEVIDLTGIGGDGLDGEWLPGIGGWGAGDALEPRGPKIDSGNNFKDGKDGTNCHTGFFNLIVSVLEDSGGHNPFIQLLAMTQLYLSLADFISDGSSSFLTSSTSPFVDVTGTRDSEGNVWADGVGIVAGFPGIYVTLSGLLSCDGSFFFEYIMGAAFGLPGGYPITYGLSGTMQPPSQASIRGPRVRPWSNAPPSKAPPVPGRGCAVVPGAP